MATTLSPSIQAFPNGKPDHHNPPADNTRPKWIAASPYLGTDHLLDLDTLDDQSRLFALALTKLQVASKDYAIVKYEDVFEFTALVSELKSLVDEEGIKWKQQDFYVVEFRSQLKSDCDIKRLGYLDKESHKEAVASGFLLKYWYGIPDGDRRNLATCFWRNKEDAMAGGRGPVHRLARAFIGQAYESILVKGLRLIIEDDVSGWKIEPYT